MVVLCAAPCCVFLVLNRTMDLEVEPYASTDNAMTWRRDLFCNVISEVFSLGFKAFKVS